MNSFKYRLPAELKNRLRYIQADFVRPPADGFVYNGELNMGPASWLATAFSTGSWALILCVVLRVFH